jgi:hypothetical protein
VPVFLRVLTSGRVAQATRGQKETPASFSRLALGPTILVETLMRGSWLRVVIVPVIPDAKLMVDPGEALAALMAARNEPGPLSITVVTVIMLVARTAGSTTRSTMVQYSR